MDTKTIPPRPKRTNEAIIKAVALRLANDVFEWCESGDDDIESIARDLEREIRFNTDGYAIAKGLDRYYSPDARLVDILDNCGEYLHTEVYHSCKGWVKANNLQPIPLETKVVWQKRKEAGVGIVTRNFDDGRACVFFASLGHVREGKGTNGTVIAWEDLIIQEEIK